MQTLLIVSLSLYPSGNLLPLLHPCAEQMQVCSVAYIRVDQCNIFHFPKLSCSAESHLLFWCGAGSACALDNYVLGYCLLCPQAVALPLPQLLLCPEPVFWPGQALSSLLLPCAGGRVKTWKRRWFILTDNCLYYFEYTTVSVSDQYHLCRCTQVQPRVALVLLCFF